ncbi:hypothetical protein JCM10207_007158 [Rhodosporidiobolus poonsookiae]
MADPGPSRAAAQPQRQSKPARLARSKAACESCHKAKQRCDGPPGPCHRCNTWGIDCIFPSSAGPTPSAKTNTARSSTPPTARPPKPAPPPPQALAQAPPPIQPAQTHAQQQHQQQQQQAQQVQQSMQLAQQMAQQIVQAGATPDVAEQLRLMNARLESLESTLSRAQLVLPPLTNLPTSATPLASSSSSSGGGAATAAAHHLAHLTHPAHGSPRMLSLVSASAAHPHPHGAAPYPYPQASSRSAGSEASPRALPAGAGVTPGSGGGGAGVHGAESERAHHDGVGLNAVETAGEAMAVEGLVDLGGGRKSEEGNGGGGGDGGAKGKGVERANGHAVEEGKAFDAAAEEGANGKAGEGLGGLGPWDAGSLRPDVLERGVMTLEECDAEFDFYFEHLQPWTCLLSTTLDRHPLVVRERSPLLFHAILLLTLYYRPRTAPNLTLYRAVSSILDSILAPQVLCPQPDQLSFDFVRAVHLVTLYKPLQFAAFHARGVSDPALIESGAKMNVRASWILRLLVSRVSAFVGLPSIAMSFAQAFAANPSTIPDMTISQTRLFLGCVFHESHGALQSGKAANFIPQDACKVTRLFAALRKQDSDVRLAASVELVATASTALLARREDGVLEDDDLRRFDDDLEQWAEYWAPLLANQGQEAEAAGEGVEGITGRDRVAWSLFYPYAAFTRLTVRGFAFNKWRAERRERARHRAQQGFALPSSSTSGAAGLGADERDSIAKAVEVAEEMMVAVAGGGEILREGRAGRDEVRRLVEEVWERSEGGPLVPDQEVVQTLKWASDSLTCVMFSYPLIFLAKLANEGLLRSDLTVVAPNSPLFPPAPMAPSDKLCRLFQLGADLLDAIAPNPHHPAVKQAAFLRKVWDAGVSGRRSVTSAPSSPHAGASAAPGQPLPPHLSLGSSALSPHGSSSSRSQTPNPATIPPPHPASLLQQLGSHMIPQPPTFPTLAAPNSAAAAALAHAYAVPHTAPPGANGAGANGVDFSLSTTYNPTPVHSPPFPSSRTNSGLAAPLPGAGSVPLVEDPFAALLSGVSPSLFDGGGAGEGFFSLDLGGGGAGVDWPDLGFGAAGMGGAGQDAYGGFGMQF